MEQELESLKSKYTEVMKINKLLEEQSSERTRESDLEGKLKDLAGYNAATGEQNASIDNVPVTGERETTNRVQTNQSSRDATPGSSRKETPMTNSRNTSTFQISRNNQAGVSRQSQECLACGSADHKIRHCDKKRNIYVRNNRGILTKEIIKNVQNNEQTKSIRQRKMHRTGEEAKEAFICFYTEQAATDAMEQIRKNHATWKTSIGYSHYDGQKKHPQHKRRIASDQMGQDLDWNANKPPSDPNLVITSRERLGFSVAQLVAMKTQIIQNVKDFIEQQFEKVTEGRPL